MLSATLPLRRTYVLPFPLFHRTVIAPDLDRPMLPTRRTLTRGPSPSARRYRTPGPTQTLPPSTGMRRIVIGLLRLLPPLLALINTVWDRRAAAPLSVWPPDCRERPSFVFFGCSRFKPASRFLCGRCCCLWGLDGPSRFRSVRCRHFSL